MDNLPSIPEICFFENFFISNWLFSVFLVMSWHAQYLQQARLYLLCAAVDFFPSPFWFSEVDKFTRSSYHNTSHHHPMLIIIQSLKTLPKATLHFYAKTDGKLKRKIVCPQENGDIIRNNIHYWFCLWWRSLTDQLAIFLHDFFRVVDDHTNNNHHHMSLVFNKKNSTSIPPYFSYFYYSSSSAASVFIDKSNNLGLPWPSQ